MGIKESTRRKWESIIQQQQQSGLSIAAFCNQQRISITQFYKHKKISTSRPTTSNLSLVEIKPEPQYPINIPSMYSGVTISVGGILFRPDVDFDESTLTKVIAILEKRTC